MTDSEKYYGELLVVKDHTEEDFRRLWAEEYCRKVIKTHDGIRVHIFSHRRAARMMWIKDVLADKEAKMYVGYDSKEKRYTGSKRVSVVKGDYVVVIQFYQEDHARFITAYVADNSIDKITSGPEWTPEKKKIKGR